MKIAIGADHRGFNHKEYLKQHARDVDWVDVGAFNSERSDFPIFVEKVCQALLRQEVQAGVLLCGSGVGMSIMANRYAHIYAALVWNEEVARKSREHNHANILVIPADFIPHEETVIMLDAWRNARPLNDKYKERIDMIDAIGGVQV